MADQDLDMDIEPLTPAPASAPAPAGAPADASKLASPPPASSEGTSRTVSRVQAGFMTPEGAGARVSRSIGLPSLWNLSPFLILDYCDVAPGQGFPDHPHRGMATVTMVLDGQLTHEDHLGHAGTLAAGDVQWMIAGRGLVHSEMPGGAGSAVRALQLWIDLPAARKMMKPRYVDRRAAQIPTVPLRAAPSAAGSTDDSPAGCAGSARVIAGELGGVAGAVRDTVNDVLLVDAAVRGAVSASAPVSVPVPAGWTAFVYVIEGAVAVAGTRVRARECAVLSAAPGQDAVHLCAAGTGTDARVLLAASPPLAQALVMQGPFAVTSRDAAARALADFRDGRNGFEKALGWRSKTGQNVAAARNGKGKGGKGKRGRKARRGDSGRGSGSE